MANRRQFIHGAAATLGAACVWPSSATAARRAAYAGPNIIVVRFGGGARRAETILPASTYSPYLCHVLSERGVLFPTMEIAGRQGLNTSHGEGTLNILTGLYDRYEDVDGRTFGAKFEARVPTLFELLRKNYEVPAHQVLLINGEDRMDEEHYTSSAHPAYGRRYGGAGLSLFRFKKYLEAPTTPGPMSEFWAEWRRHYGESGLRNPRGDRLLTELTVWAIRRLRPRFLIVNYNDCDYVHWGNASHYSRGIQIMDEGLKRLVDVVAADPAYRANTVFAVVPDCGRDDNRFMEIPFQHHFNTRSSREIFALFFGAGIAEGQRVDRIVQQVDVAPTLAALMGIKAPDAEGRVLEEVYR